MIASLTTFLITFVIFRQKISGPYKQILEASTLVLVFDILIKIIIYYLHERLWTNINMGKIHAKHLLETKGLEKDVPENA
ncbi:MAG: DUF2061 domain-containing protein [Bacteroidales bacterium]